MNLEIRGLSCASCKKDIPADGVTCAACTAPHHWPCYAGAGHCATCQSAKPPVPFCVAPRAAPPGTGRAVMVGALVALMLGAGALALVVVRENPVAPVQVAVQAPALDPARIPLPPVPPRPPARRQFMPPPPPPDLAEPLPGTRVEVRAQPERARTMLKTRGRRIEARASKYPGRLQGYLQDAALSDSAGDQLELTLSEPVRALFVSAEVRPGAMPGPMALRARTQSKGAGFADAGSFTVPPSGRRWYRLDAQKPFDEVRLKLEGSGAALSFSSFAGLLEKPAGEVIDASRVATVKALEGNDVVLASQKGATVKLPRNLFPPRGSDGAVSLASPDGNVILRMSRDGNVSVFDVRSAGVRSFGTHVLSLHGQSPVRDETGDAWIDAIGVWALLDRWHPANARDAAFSPALETTAVLNEDGSLALYRPNMSSPMQTEIEGLDELELMLGALDRPGDDVWTADRHRATMRLNQMGLTARRGEALSRSQRELVRFLREDVVPRFRKLVGPSRPIAAGDRCALTWRSNVFNYARMNGLTLTMLDRDVVVVRPTERATSSPEIELPREFLPAAPAARVGQSLYLDWDSTR